MRAETYEPTDITSTAPPTAAIAARCVAPPSANDAGAPGAPIAWAGEALLQYVGISGIPNVPWSSLEREAGRRPGAVAFLGRRPNQAFLPSPFDNAGILSSRPPVRKRPLPVGMHVANVEQINFSGGVP